MSWWKTLPCIREIPISNLESDTIYPDSCSVFFFSVCRQVRNNRSNWAKTDFFHFFFNSFSRTILSVEAVYSELLKLCSIMLKWTNVTFSQFSLHCLFQLSCGRKSVYLWTIFYSTENFWLIYCALKCEPAVEMRTEMNQIFSFAVHTLHERNRLRSLSVTW